MVRRCELINPKLLHPPCRLPYQPLLWPGLRRPRTAGSCRSCRRRRCPRRCPRRRRRLRRWTSSRTTLIAFGITLALASLSHAPPVTITIALIAVTFALVAVACPPPALPSPSLSSSPATITPLPSPSLARHPFCHHHSHLCRRHPRLPPLSRAPLPPSTYC